MNRLAQETSPYLLQHSANPVDWWPWGEDALAEARRSRKPILLSVGYAACHWCHVMAHESFEDEATARVMNDLFINIKVDREERPDVDHLYMSALHALGEAGGWPLTMFLTPTGEPFWGGTYFPKEPRFGRPGFVAVLREVARLCRDEPERIEHNRRVLAAGLARQGQAAAQEAIGRPELDRIGTQLARTFDAVDGGLPGAPKFPNPPLLELLWRQADRCGDAVASSAFLHTLKRMACGGIHDHLGGGFARYAVDARWLVPHFEKMLYDNAQLLELYALAAAETGRPILREAAEGIVAWALREMLTPEGAFAASLDADSEGEEGRFYVWSDAEIRALLGADADLFARHYGVTPDGNWEGRVILNRLDSADPDAPTAARLAELRQRLLAHRGKRPRPACDDKVLCDWNGLMIAALARAAVLLDRPDWLATAQRAFRFITESMMREDRLGHSWRAGRLLFPGLASDHAAMARAAMALYEATSDASWLERARLWVSVTERDFADADGILFMTAADAADLFLRPQPLHDDAVPNANGMHAENVVRLALLSGRADDRERADRLLAALTRRARAAPVAHGSILNALDLHLCGASIVVTGSGRETMLRAARSVPYPNRTVLDLDPASGASFDEVRQAQISASPGTATAFVCAGDRCSLPVTDPNRLHAAVDAERAGVPPPV
ncbi:thioredoxin domain-containing protein [Chelatococcus sp. SYSU_G07232]|uniref:Thioredoxin domain-containing protein n=1 Tax=Chelatococcus albus TaxID=3047466 RepID=A0ABT7AH81_9HYPH|nr:thioredoxin domain-containing protein [Chelatococcus sp. SYSU_G07232]MDJ1158713.1 thioredoxin domain-containing protein [Chelatococcus sp. SYSU_G07232]